MGKRLLILDWTLTTDQRRESTQVHLGKPMSTLERLSTSEELLTGV